MRTTMATENNNKNLNVPNLRFPEFSGEWTKTLLNNYLEENKERNKRGIFTKNHVLSVSGDFGIVNQIELLGRSFAGKSVLDYHVVRTGNIVYTKSPLKEYPYGIVKVNGGVDGIVSTLYAVYKVKETANGKFVEYYFGLPNRTNRYFKPIVRIGAKHDMKIGNDEVLANYVVFPCVDEQKRISDFICLLDERIATQIKIIEKLESLIRGIVETHYSQCDCIKQVRISELGEPFSTMNMSKEDLSEDGNECILYGELFTTYGCVIKEVKSRTHISTNKATVSQSNDLLFPTSTTVDAMSLIAPSAICKEGVMLGGDLFGVHVNKNYNNEYLSYLINYIYKSKLARYAQGSTIIHLHYSDIKNATLLLPTIEEQNYLAHIMRGVEEKINIEKDMLSKLYSQKAYLLSNLFI